MINKTPKPMYPENQPDIDFEPPPIQRWYGRTRYTQPQGGESCTDRSFGNDTDINHIVERFARTGTMPEQPETLPFEDVTELQGDLTDLLDKAQKGIDAVEQLEKEKHQAQQAQDKKDAEELQQFRDFKAQQESQNPADAEASQS